MRPLLGKFLEWPITGHITGTELHAFKTVCNARTGVRGRQGTAGTFREKMGGNRVFGKSED